ncbi:MAG: ABC transporter substrate-binding protein [Syntrophobacterales bacterium]|nr:ABC transporter substrate-binding protein [Syntrophobacterales bacterium]
MKPKLLSLLLLICIAFLPPFVYPADPPNVRFSQCFKISYYGDYKKLEVRNPWRGARKGFEYILVPKGKPFPKDIPSGSIVIPIPIERVAILSTTFTAFFPMLGVESSIIGLGEPEWTHSPQIISLIREGRIIKVGRGRGMGLRFDEERLVALKPDIVILYGTGNPATDQHPKLIEGGFKPIIVAPHMENHPLGRAEWIKFLAAFFNKESEAERVFNDIVSRYETLSEKTKNVTYRPTVFCNVPIKGTWHMPGGGGYLAKFIQDAGGKYLWDDDKSTGVMTISTEAVVERARDADFWIGVIMPVKSLEELKGVDERFSLFKAFREGKVYNNDAKVNDAGGNDFWETGVARPDLVISDFIRILHPEILPDHKLIWYRQLPKSRER